MFAFSITFKLLSLYLGLHYGDAGPQSRPWILGTVIGLVFATFDAASGPQALRIIVGYFVAYLVAALLFTHVYYRLTGILWSLLTAAVGTGVLFFGVPYLVMNYAAE
jgi:hypothetical protein